MSPASYLTAPPRVAARIVARLGLRRREPYRAADPGTTEAAVAVRVLREVLLVVRLGVVERAPLRDLRRDLAVAGIAQLALEDLARPLGGSALRLVLPVDRRAVLRAG